MATKAHPHDLPTGTVTILFTDIEGSTRLLQRLGPDAYGRLLGDHHRLIRDAVRACRGVEIKTEGDAFFIVFQGAADALTAAVQAQRELALQDWPGGEHRAARISAAAHGGQVLLSATTAALVGAALPAGVSIRDLGEHLLKDIDAAEHLHQLVIDGLPSHFPPPRAASTRFDLLPADASSFVGREPELQRARELLAGTRLLTLTGPGGTGKTRLALTLARTVADDFADGVAFVALAAISEPRLVPSTIRQGLGLSEQPGRTALETLADRLEKREVLIVLDNFEQVAAAASSVAELLEAASALTLIVTSRVALHIEGEQEFAVPSLTVPSATDEVDLDQLSRADAVALFLQRARAVRPDFTLTDTNARMIIEICARLDGLPLAIELAASRIKLLPPQALLERLAHRLDFLQSTAADRTDRQRTLRGAIDWSYGLLNDSERALFRRLAVFVGGWRLDDADPVASAAAPLGLDVLDGLAALVDHSLVRQIDDAAEVRFGMLETIREFGREQLDAALELAHTSNAHARRFAALVEEAETRLTAGAEWPDRLETDHANIRAALAWLADHDLELALFTAGRLWRFWHLRGHLREGTAVLSALLDRPDAQAGTVARAKALIGLGGLVYWQTTYSLARASYEEALSIVQATGERRLEVELLYSLAYVRAIGRDWDGATRDYRAAQALYESQGDDLMAAWAVAGVGMVETIRGEHAAAISLLEEAIRRFEALGDTFGMRNALAVETRALMHLGRLDDARRLNRRVIDLAQAQHDITSLSATLHDAGSLAALAGDLERAAILAGAAQRIVEESGGQPPPELVNRIEAMPTLEREMVPKRLADLIAEGRRLSIDEAAAIALSD
jgi:predicted ATPase/class 3 adenylate cyclase